MTAQSDDAADNYVHLRGRLAAAPTEKELPSGDVLVVFRLIVPRPAGDRATVDTIECTATAARPRRRLATVDAGAELEVEGSLRRRFWRAPSGPTSRYTVSVDAVRVAKKSVDAGPATRSAGRRVGA